MWFMVAYALVVSLATISIDRLYSTLAWGSDRRSLIAEWRIRLSWWRFSHRRRLAHKKRGWTV